MRSNILVLVLAAILLSGVMPAQAEHEWDHRYVIEGKVLSPDGGVMRWMTVEIDCSEDATDSSLCGNNIERADSTGFSGNYELILHIHSGDHGMKIVLDVDGQKFEHIIDLRDDGSFKLNMKYFAYDYGLTMTNDRFAALFGQPVREGESEMEQFHWESFAFSYSLSSLARSPLS
jgi:hypothetical protein